jgi:protein SCO1/2
MKYRITFILSLLTIMATWSCQSGPEIKEGPLPKLGNFYVEGQDTVYHQIADFEFVNQMGDTVSTNTVKGKVYVADFFFTSCPTICPIMKKEMLRIFEKYDGDPNFQILSHSIDPTFDTVEMLRDYSQKLGIENASTWNFLTGDQEKIFEIGQTSYLTTAMADQNEPGGFLHSGAFILVDQKGYIRGVYDGTKTDQVDRLLNAIPKLLTK